VDQFEKNLKDSDQKVDQETQAGIDKLETQADKLQTKLEELAETRFFEIREQC